MPRWRRCLALFLFLLLWIIFTSFQLRFLFHLFYFFCIFILTYFVWLFFFRFKEEQKLVNRLKENYSNRMFKYSNCYIKRKGKSKEQIEEKIKTRSKYLEENMQSKIAKTAMYICNSFFFLIIFFLLLSSLERKDNGKVSVRERKNKKSK